MEVVQKAKEDLLAEEQEGDSEEEEEDVSNSILRHLSIYIIYTPRVCVCVCVWHCEYVYVTVPLRRRETYLNGH